MIYPTPGGPPDDQRQRPFEFPEEPIPDSIDIERTLSIVMMLGQADETVVTKVCDGFYGRRGECAGVLGKLVGDSLDYLAEAGFISQIGTTTVFEPTEKAWNHLSPSNRQAVVELSPFAKKIAEEGYSVLDMMPDNPEQEDKPENYQRPDAEPPYLSKSSSLSEGKGFSKPQAVIATAIGLTMIAASFGLAIKAVIFGSLEIILFAATIITWLIMFGGIIAGAGIRDLIMED